VTHDKGSSEKAALFRACNLMEGIVRQLARQKMVLTTGGSECLIGDWAVTS